MNNLLKKTLLDSVIGAIRNTPLVELCRITRDMDGRIFAKLEYLNPGFSSGANVAAALQLLRTAHQGKTIIV